jgi:thiamine-monophosphate kinase
MTQTTTEPPALEEFGRIARHFRPLAAGFPGALDLTDDAALVSVAAGDELVVTTDAMVEGIHFLASDPPGEIAAKLLRVNLSDLAAMGAAPVGYTLVTALPASVSESWLTAFAAGLESDQGQYGISLIGGDSVSTRGPLTLAVTALGRVPKGAALTRRGARPGDLVCVSGTIGDAALGLAIALGSLEVSDAGQRDFLLARLRRPEPRLTLGLGLRGLASAAVDVSDGLVADLGHLAAASGLAAEIEAGRVPLSAAAAALVSGHPERIPGLLTGGDDYELVVTVAPGRAQALPAGLTVIGRVVAGNPGSVTVRDETGTVLDLPRRGWNHFGNAGDHP